jgi:hypothetical protein
MNQILKSKGKRERERERERKEQIRSQDLKLAGVRWLHWRPEFLAGAVGLLLPQTPVTNF